MTRMVSAIYCLITLLVLISGSFALASEPLYRYALRHTAPSPYEIYHFSNAPPSVATLLLHESTHQVAGTAGPRLNLSFSYVNVIANPTLAGLPVEVRHAWFEKSDRSLPTFALFSPQGVEIYAGPLAPNDVHKAAESSLGNRLVQQLASNDGVMLLLITNSKNSSKNWQQIQWLSQEMKQLLRDIRKSRTAGATDEPGATVSLLQSPLKVGFLHLERKPSTTDWCERSILALLPPESRKGDVPAVMILYGRGRALPAKTGKQILRESLIADFETLLAPFDSTNRRPLPGSDLLLRADWEKLERQINESKASQMRVVVQRPIIPNATSMQHEEFTSAPMTTLNAATSVSQQPETKVTALRPMEASSPAKLGPFVNSENAVATGIIVALLGIFLLTFSIIRAQ